MTPAAELALLEAAYTGLLTSNIKSYTIEGRTLVKNDLSWIAGRMDLLRVVIQRQTNGGNVQVAAFRDPE